MDKKSGRRKLRTYILLIAIILLSLFMMAFNHFASKSGKNVVICVNKEIVYRLSLSEDKVIEIDGYDGGKNTVTIENGTCFVSYADCPDKLCKKQGKISKSGESIICLPHRVVITIGGEDDKKIDTIAK